MKAANYVKVADDDHKLFANVLWQARGDMSLNNFAIKCNGNARNFYRHAYAECTKSIPPKMIHAILDNAPITCEFTEEALMAVAGMLDQALLHAIYYQYLNDIFSSETQKKESEHTSNEHLQIFDEGMLCSISPLPDTPVKQYKKKPVKILDREEYIQEINRQMSDDEKEALRYLSYINDLAFFSLTLSNNEIKYIKRNIHTLYKSRTIVRLLHNFHESVIKEDNDNVEKLILFFKGDDPENIPELSDNVSSLHDVLKDLLLND